MKTIELSRKEGKDIYTIVDDSIYDWLNQYFWIAKRNNNGDIYAARSMNIGKWNSSERTTKTISMHREIMQVGNSKIQVDHIDHNTLNNQKSNLRIATRSQNQANRKKKVNATSKYLGVHSTKQGIWYASCRKDGKCKKVRCSTEIEAALTYNEMAKELHGEFACLNEIEYEKE